MRIDPLTDILLDQRRIPNLEMKSILSNQVFISGWENYKEFEVKSDIFQATVMDDATGLNTCIRKLPVSAT